MGRPVADVDEQLSGAGGDVARHVELFNCALYPARQLLNRFCDLSPDSIRDVTASTGAIDQFQGSGSMSGESRQYVIGGVAAPPADSDLIR